jgi:glycosyltransferase involved in cell wall biosynthesis
MNKRRVMVLCGQAPWPRNGGALLRNYWMIDALRKQYAVDLVVADEATPIPPDFAAVIDDYACFPRRPHERGGISRLVRAALPGESSLTAGWTSPELREYVADRLGRYPYAAIQSDLAMHAALPRRDAIPIVYNAHNCESALLTRRASNEPPHIAAALLLDAGRVRRLERALITRAGLVAVCAESDLLDFEKFVPGVRAKAAIVPNGVDIERYRGVGYATPEPCTVLITGSMDWRPNVLGLRWFIRTVLPRLRDALPNVVVRVAGRMEPALIEELRPISNLEVAPNPPSMDPHLGDATVVVAPIIASSGTRLRILEAWAAKRPVLTTTPGAFGLDCTTDEELVIRDEPAAFTDALVRMLESDAMRAGLVERASQRVKRYEWREIGNELRAAYARLSGERPLESVPVLSEEVALSAAL